MSVIFLTDEDKAILDRSIQQNTSNISSNTAAVTTLVKNMEDGNCVDYLGKLPDIEQTTENGVTYTCKDNVFTFSGPASGGVVIMRLFDNSNAVPKWWIPGKTVRIVFEKSNIESFVELRIYEYAADGSLPLLFKAGYPGVFEYTIPADFDGKGVQIRIHIYDGGITDTTAVVKILNTWENAELVDIVKGVRDPLHLNMVKGSYVYVPSGDTIANELLFTSDPINVSAYAGMKLLIRSRLMGNQGFAFYSHLPCNTYSFISGVSGNSSGLEGALVDYETEVPENAEWLRITALDGYEDNCSVIPRVTLAGINANTQKGGRRVFARNVAMFGDSITLGRDGNDGGSPMVITTNSIPSTVGKMLNANVVNHGVGSMGWLAPGDNMTAYDKLASVDLTAYDTVTLCFGVNDHFRPLGDSWETRDEATCMGQFHKCIEYIYQQNPSCRVIVIAPFNGRNVGTFPDYWYGDAGWSKLDEMLNQACDYYWIPYISQRNGPINAYTIQTLIGEDGVHPSEEGYQRIGEWIAGELRRLIG